MSASRPLRIAATLLASAALLGGTAAVPASAAAHPHYDHSRVTIGKVRYNSPGYDTRSNRSLNGEWVQVRNTGRRAVDLQGWTLGNQSGQRYRFHHLWLRGHDSVIVHTGYGRDTRHDVYQDRPVHVWNNHHDTATLRDRRGYQVDSITWTNRRHHHRH
jgi:lamin tail-like protein